MVLSLEPFKAAFPGRVVRADDSTYQEEVRYSWSITNRIPAAAYIYLNSKEDAAKALSIIKAANSKFAIRAAGHNANPGFSSVKTKGTGVVLDLRGLNSKALDKDAGLAHISAGNNWSDMFTWLEAEDICVLGSREGRVGVSGFVLGCGQGIFSSSHSLGADGVESFGVVLANGEIATANKESHKDLYKSLKGGGSKNFGIVTALSLRVHPLIKVQYTINMYHPSDYINVLNAFAHVQASMEEGPRIGLFINTRRSFIGIGLFYADWPAETPEAFTPFSKLSSFLGAAVPNANGTFSSLNAVLEQWGYKEKDLKHAYVTMTTKNQQDLYEEGHEAWKEVVGQPSPAADLHWTIQPLSQRAVQAGKQKGGNSLGLVDVPQSCWIFACDWKEDEHDEAIATALDQLLQRIEQLAPGRDLLLDLRFPTFAGHKQNVIFGFGAEVVEKLRETACRYDPDGVFQSLQCRGFLLRDI